MRETWGQAPAVDISIEEMTRLIQPAFPGRTVVDVSAAVGGLANANLKLSVSGLERPVLLRFFVRDPAAAGKERAIAERLQGIAPVPRYLYSSDTNEATGHAYAIVEWVDGVRLELVPEVEAAEIAVGLGRTLGQIHSVTFPATGFLDGALAVTQEIAIGGDGLVGFLRFCIADGRGRARLGDDLTDRLMAFVEAESGLLDRHAATASLTHCDFGGSNLLVDKQDGRWSVAGVVDWEFAIAGSPIMDLGNLLRPPLGDMPGFAERVAEGFRSVGRSLPDNWRRMSLLIDLTSWADFLNRPSLTDGVVRSACERIRSTMAAFESD